MKDIELQRPFLETLEAILGMGEKENLNYVIIGAIAMGLHGYIRATDDIDLLFDKKSFEKFKLIARQYGFKKCQGVERNYDYKPTGIGIDILVEGDLPKKDSPISFPNPNDIVEIKKGIPISNMNNLVIIKLIVYRMKDKSDIVEMLKKDLINIPAIYDFIADFKNISKRFDELIEVARKEQDEE